MIDTLQLQKHEADMLALALKKAASTEPWEAKPHLERIALRLCDGDTVKIEVCNERE